MNLKKQFSLPPVGVRYGMTPEYLAESAKAYKAVLWYGWAGFLFALLTPADTLIQHSELFQRLMESVDSWLPMKSMLADVSPHPELIRFWLSTMYCLLPIAILHFAYKWPAPPKPPWQQSLGIFLGGPAALLMLGVPVFFIFYDPRLPVDAGVSRGSIFNHLLLTSRLGLGLLGSTVFYSVAFFAGGWLKFIYTTSQKFLTATRCLFRGNG